MTRGLARLPVLVAAVLAVILVLLGLLVFFGPTVPLSQDEDPEAGAAGPARCEEHGISSPDPRADPEPVSGAENEGAGAEGAVQLDQEFTADGVTSGYHLYTRDVDFDEPVGVVVRLHGDGGAEYAEPDGLLNCLAAVAASHNMMLLAPLTPDVNGEETWWEDISTNLPWLQDLLSARVLETYAPDTEDVWWMGYSGGAEMISYGVLPRSPQVVTGGAVMIGGGGSPGALREEPTAEQRASLDLTWITGTLDDGSVPYAPFDALTAAQEGSSWYREQGFQQVRAEFPEGEDHFSLPQARILEDALRQ